MNYLLDTNICIHFFRGKFGVTKRLKLYKLKIVQFLKSP